MTAKTKQHPARTPAPPPSPAAPPGGKQLFFAAAVLASMVFLLYLSTGTHDFIGYDDAAHVTENSIVRDGLSLRALLRAFMTPHESNWIPVTWLSHMLDVSLFGMHPGPHHLMNAFLHALATALLLAALYLLTGAFWPSIVTAALFGVHPLNVESVAWIAERKNVLSTVFFMLVLISYQIYARKGRLLHYAAALLFLGVGLMAKPMLVTVPFVLLLLDVWPLNRTSLYQPAGAATEPWRRLLLEKAPFLALAAAASIITYVVQRDSGAMSLAQSGVLPLWARISNAVLAYASYIGKILWPSDLALLYPHPGTDLPWAQVLGSFVLLAAVTAVVMVHLKRRPYLAVGWFWFLGTLVPVIGIVQVGFQAMADRYAYLPMVGMFIMLIWSAAEGTVSRPPWTRMLLGAIAGIVLAAFGAATIIQTGYWWNSITVFSHTLSVTHENYRIQVMLGRALADRELYDEALTEFREALRIRPDHAPGLFNLANTLADMGRHREAVEQYQKLVSIKPGYAKAHNNMANSLAALGRREEAIGHFREALRLIPDFPAARANLDLLLAGQ